MNKTCIIYGSSTGTCQDLASRIATKLGVDSADVFDVSKVSADQLGAYQNLILGTSTWGAGEMQDDWYDGVKTLKAAGLSGKTVAIFGCGDSEGYCDTYDDSEAVVDGHFVGLALDEVNEDDKTDERIDAWVKEIQPEL